MKTPIIAILSVSFIAIVLVSAYAYSLKSRLQNSENNFNELRKQMQKTEETFTILNEMNDRQNRVICDYQNELKRIKDEQINKISRIEESDDACDWLDAPVPFSIGVLFGTSVDERVHPNEASCGASDKM